MNGAARPGASGSGTRRALRVLAHDAALVLALAAALEVALQISAPRYRRHLFNDHFTGGFPMERSAPGFRGPVPPIGPAPGELRVMTLGDSVTMGTGVAAASTFAHALGPDLAARSGRTVTTINAGVEGWALKELRVAFEGRWALYRPGVVVIAVSGNVVSRAWIDRDREISPQEVMVGEAPEPVGLAALRARAVRASKRLCTPAFISQGVQRLMYGVGLVDHSVNPAAPFGAMVAHGWRQIGLDPSVPDRAWQCFERDLRDLCSSVTVAGARVLVTATPARFMISDRSFDNEKYVPRNRLTIDPGERVRAACAAVGVEYADSYAALRAARAADPDAPLYIQFDYTHLDEQGHSAVAGALARTIAARGDAVAPDRR